MLSAYISSIQKSDTEDLQRRLTSQSSHISALESTEKYFPREQSGYQPRKTPQMEFNSFWTPPHTNVFTGKSTPTPPHPDEWEKKKDNYLSCEY